MLRGCGCQLPDHRPLGSDPGANAYLPRPILRGGPLVSPVGHHADGRRSDVEQFPVPDSSPKSILAPGLWRCPAFGQPFERLMSRMFAITKRTACNNVRATALLLWKASPSNSFYNRRLSLRPYSWVALLFSGAITAVVLAACGG